MPGTRCHGASASSAGRPFRAPRGNRPELRPGCRRDADDGESVPFPPIRDAQAEFVVFRQAIRSEGCTGRVAFGEPLQCCSRDRATDAGERNSRPERVAYDHCLAMRLGKFLAVMAADPAGTRLRHGQDRDLRQLRPIHGLVEQHKCGRINHVFRVVQHDHSRASAQPGFVEAQRAVKPVEAVGLGRRACDVVDHKPHARVGLHRPEQCANRCAIVAVTADVDRQFVLSPDLEGMVYGRADDCGFLPRRNEHCPRPRERFVRPGFAARRGFAQPPGQLEPEPRTVDKDFIDRANKEKDTGK